MHSHRWAVQNTSRFMRTSSRNDPREVGRFGSRASLLPPQELGPLRMEFADRPQFRSCLNTPISGTKYSRAILLCQYEQSIKPIKCACAFSANPAGPHRAGGAAGHAGSVGMPRESGSTPAGESVRSGPWGGRTRSVCRVWAPLAFIVGFVARLCRGSSRVR